MPNVTVTHASDNPNPDKVEATKQAQRDKAEARGDREPAAKPAKAKAGKSKSSKPKAAKSAKAKG